MDASSNTLSDLQAAQRARSTYQTRVYDTISPEEAKARKLKAFTSGYAVRCFEQRVMLDRAIDQLGSTTFALVKKGTRIFIYRP